MLTNKKRTPKGSVQGEIKKLLNKEHNACYILITCQEPTSDGKMNVEMTYEGDTGLASYLIDNAQTFFDQAQPDDI